MIKQIQIIFSAESQDIASDTAIMNENISAEYPEFLNYAIAISNISGGHVELAISAMIRESDMSSILRLEHHAEAFYNGTTFEHVHVEVYSE